MDRNKHDIEVLKEFLGFPINNSDNVFDKFLQIPKNIYHADPEKNERRFIYIPGSRQNKVVLVAHADTICKNNDSRVEFYEENDFFYGKDNSFLPADDRAGCAILWLLKDSGHSLLITDGEESGKIGTNYIKDEYPDIFNEINSHQFMIEFDRKNGNDCVFYNVGSEKFVEYIQKGTGFKEAEGTGSDIKELCRDICGVNFSIGYYNEHSVTDSKISLYEWSSTLNTMRGFLDRNLPKFVLKEKNIW